MNGNIQETTRQHALNAENIEVGSIGESITGIAGIVLAIIGLAHVLPQILLPVATIALGAAFLFEGTGIAARFSKLLSETSQGRFDSTEMGIGLTSELMGGVAGVVLGILALIGIAMNVLVPAAAIVYGATLLFGSGINSRLNTLQFKSYGEHDVFGEVAREAVKASTSVQMLLGLVSITLGILAIVGINPMTLAFVALLCVGVSDMVSGTAIAARMMSALK